MKLPILCVIMLYSTLSSSAQLIQRVTDKPKSDMYSNEDVKDITSSKEKIYGSEIIHFYKEKVRTARHDTVTPAKNVTRKPDNPQVKSKAVLVKKPIPKYKETNSDEDYQSKQSKTKWQLKQVDSIEHEDEDFSLDDYDFDVNHDEFVGRGKPLEPRKELKKTMQGLKTNSAHKTKRNPVTSETKTVAEKKPLIKQTKKAADKMKYVDYDEEFSTTENNIVSKAFNSDNDLSDEVESSSEYRIFIRNARSPWNIGTYVDKIGEKTTALMTKILGFLPLFPQIPDNRKMFGTNPN